MNCVECSTEQKKYKCPKCSENCCSFECFKKHKSVDCSPAITQTNSTNDTEQSTSSQRRILQFTTDDTVDPDKLEKLGDSDAVKDLLRNKHLRDLILAIDSSENAWKSMSFAMLEPLFIEFADECMKIVEPETPE